MPRDKRSIPASRASNRSNLQKATLGNLSGRGHTSSAGGGTVGGGAAALPSPKKSKVSPYNAPAFIMRPNPVDNVTRRTSRVASWLAQHHNINTPHLQPPPPHHAAGLNRTSLGKKVK